MEQQEAIQKLLKNGIIPTAKNLENIQSNLQTNVEVIKTFNFEPHKIAIREFTESNRAKYSFLRNILMNRAELQNTISISRISQTTERNVTILGMVYEISKLPTGTFRLVIEDLSGRVTAIVPKSDPELVKKISFVTNDEVLGFVGSYAKNVFFIKDVIWPGIPQKQIPLCPDEVYVAFLADTHVGSNMFLEKQFSRLIDWFAGEYGTEEQRKIAKQVKYFLLVGDVVDGVGVYPQQDRELHITDIYEQYKQLAKYLIKIPGDKHIIICPGTHDGLRIEDPRPKITKHLANELHEMANILFVTNPAIVRLHNVSNYAGINILMYHGDSFDYYVNNVESLRLLGGYDKPEEIHKYLLKRRNLSPDFKGMEQLPMKENPLIIHQVPDVIATGHIHKLGFGSYRGVITISTSCFQARTSYQEKLGHHPDPGKIILLNLKNLKIKIIDFLEDEE